jgi:hypothetical protein
MNQMASYQFHITEGPQVQEILVGVKKSFTAFFTQKVEFKSGVSILRPGALLSMHLDGEDYTILFLLTKSRRITCHIAEYCYFDSLRPSVHQIILKSSTY